VRAKKDSPPALTVVPDVGSFEAIAALLEGARLIVTKNSAGLLDALAHFASLLVTSVCLAKVRFEEEIFAELLRPWTSSGGTDTSPAARARIFQRMINPLAGRCTVRRIIEQLTEALGATDLSRPDRDAIAVALVCLEPVLANPALPARQSPTLEVIFNVQFGAWWEPT